VSNTITYVTPKLLASGLLALREQAIMPRLVNKSYGELAQEKGNVINIPVPSAIAARAVTASVVHNSNVASAPTNIAVTLDQWYEAPFEMTDNDLLSTIGGFVPMQASEAVKGLINVIDKHILGKHTGIYSFTGTHGTTPFASGVTSVGAARTLLNAQLCPADGRVGVLDPDAEGALLGTSNVLQFDQRGDTAGIINGSIGRKFAIDWYMDQNISSFTPGTAWVTNWTFGGLGAVGDVTISALCTTSGTVLVGDIFTYSSQQYAITTAATAVTATALSLTIYPPAKIAFVSGDDFTCVDATAYVPNLVFHPLAFCFASRPLASSIGFGNQIASVSDPISGVALRLELSRQYKLTTYSYDALWGAGMVRKEFATKIVG